MGEIFATIYGTVGSLSCPFRNRREQSCKLNEKSVDRGAVKQSNVIASQEKICQGGFHPKDEIPPINWDLQLYLFPDFGYFLFCTLKLRPRINSIILLPWNNMNVEMRNRLPGAFATCVKNIDTIITAAVYQMI